ncbi:MAG: hypothetical protein IKC09_05405 [Oscillospiraceae bacterium]|nr:hypothetical protein [Oscillospiraceae bacterium]MBR2889695.1 hypothetical protein [Oscillospiraceae bacterium]
MEFDEAQELAFLNAATRRNRQRIRTPGRRRYRFPLVSAMIWILGTLLMLKLAHQGAIPGWLMHLTTVILTFRFAFELGRFLELKGE